MYNFKIINMTILNFENFMKNYKLKNDTMNESQLQRIYNYPIYPRDSKKKFSKDLLISTREIKWGRIGLVL